MGREIPIFSTNDEDETSAIAVSSEERRALPGNVASIFSQVQRLEGEELKTYFEHTFHSMSPQARAAISEIMLTSLSPRERRSAEAAFYQQRMSNYTIRSSLDHAFTGGRRQSNDSPVSASTSPQRRNYSDMMEIEIVMPRGDAQLARSADTNRQPQDLAIEMLMGRMLRSLYAAGGLGIFSGGPGPENRGGGYDMDEPIEPEMELEGAQKEILYYHGDFDGWKLDVD